MQPNLQTGHQPFWVYRKETDADGRVWMVFDGWLHTWNQGTLTKTFHPDMKGKRKLITPNAWKDNPTRKEPRKWDL